jgi:hypothetical protein
MTPDQLLGLQRHARAKTVTLTPEITIENPDAIPTGTQESVPIEITESFFVPAAAITPPPIAAAVPDPTPDLPRNAAAPGPLGAIIGFLIFGAWTVTETVLIALS